MTLDQICDWCKATVPGIILLGAIGSILAVFALWLLTRLARGLSAAFKGVYRISDKLAHRHFILNVAFLEDCQKRRDHSAIVLYVFSRTMRSFVCLALSIAAALFAYYAHANNWRAVALLGFVTTAEFFAVLAFWEGTIIFLLCFMVTGGTWRRIKENHKEEMKLGVESALLATHEAKKSDDPAQA